MRDGRRRAVLRAGFWRRHFQRAFAAAVRTVLPRGQSALTRVGRNGPRPGDRETRGACARWHNQGRKRAEPWLDVLLYFATAAGTGTRLAILGHHCNLASPSCEFKRSSRGFYRKFTNRSYAVSYLPVNSLTVLAKER